MTELSQDPAARARQLIHWFDESVQPLLQKHVPEKLNVLLDDRKRLERWERRSEET